MMQHLLQTIGTTFGSNKVNALGPFLTHFPERTYLGIVSEGENGVTIVSHNTKLCVL